MNGYYYIHYISDPEFSGNLCCSIFIKHQSFPII